MPSLFRFLVVVAVLAGLVYAGLYALANFVQVEAARDHADDPVAEGEPVTNASRLARRRLPRRAGCGARREPQHDRSLSPRSLGLCGASPRRRPRCPDRRRGGRARIPRGARVGGAQGVVAGAPAIGDPAVPQTPLRGGPPKGRPDARDRGTAPRSAAAQSVDHPGRRAADRVGPAGARRSRSGRSASGSRSRA